MSIATFGRTDDREARKQAEEISGRKKELREKLNETQAQLEQARSAFAEGKGSATEATDLLNQRDRLKLQLEDVEQAHKSLLGQLAPGGQHGIDPTGLLSEQFADPEFQQGLRRIAHSSGRVGDVQIGEIDSKALAEIVGGGSLQAATGGIVTPPPAGEVGPYRGIMPYPTPPTTFLDLVPTGSYDNGSLPYSQEVVENGDPGPAPAAPGTVKAAMGVGYQDATAGSTTIAGWVKVNRQALADNGYLQNSIQNRALQKLRVSIEKEVLSGDGSVSDVAGVEGIRGVLNTTGIGSVDAAGVTSEPDAILDAIVALLVSGANPNAIVLNPVDWATVLKSKATGSGEYVASPFLSQVRTMWDVAFLPSVAIEKGSALLLDTRIALTLLLREGANVRISDSDQDSFVKNQLTILIECRALLPVWIPAAICEVVNLGAPAA